MFDVQSIRKDFPIFKEHPDLVYLDSASTSLKPQPVIEAVTNYYSKYSANIHRGIYKLSEKASDEFESARVVVANFIGADSADEVVFTRGTTEALNLLAYSLGDDMLDQNSEVVVSVMEHHANFVPWQQIALRKSSIFKVIDITDDGILDLKNEDISSEITDKTKIVSLTYASNVLGTINPLKKIITQIRKKNPKTIVIVDAAQCAPHRHINVKDLGCDFLAFSAHKMSGPTGVGVLWGKKSLLDNMSPFNYGGNMIREVSIDKTIFDETPHKFEAGTSHIAGVIGLKSTIEYLQDIGLNNIAKHETELVTYAIDQLEDKLGDNVQIVGPRKHRAGLVALTMKHCHPHDIAHILDEHNVAIRAGNHCTMPLHERLGIAATARASFYIYTTKSDIDTFAKALKKTHAMFS